MAIGPADLDVLITLADQGYIPRSAAVVEIGTQQLADEFLGAADKVQCLGRFFDRSADFALAAPLNSSGGLDPAAPLARDFWTWLGFGYAAIDIDGSPGSIPLDLNYDPVPQDHVGRYHLVTNYGTTEHVANQLNAFKVIHDLTAQGGVMIHTLPAQGMPNHGLINYNPKFFWMLARSNGYKWLHEDYQGDGLASGYDLPQNIVDRVALYFPDAETRSKTVIYDAGIRIALQKQFDLPFVAPLDIATGVTTDNAALAQRYWTVFTPNAFEQLPPSAKPATGTSLVAEVKDVSSPR